MHVDSDMIENCGVADLGGVESEAFDSVAFKGLVEKPTSDEALSNLAVLGRYNLPSEALDLRENTKAGVGDERQLTDALDELLKHDGLNSLETDTGIHDGGNKQVFLSAILAVGMRDPETREEISNLFKKSAL